jgi:hypothetical protein
MYSEQSGAAQTETRMVRRSVNLPALPPITEGARKYLNARGVLRESVDFDVAKNFD